MFKNLNILKKELGYNALRIVCIAVGCYNDAARPNYDAISKSALEDVLIANSRRLSPNENCSTDDKSSDEKRPKCHLRYSLTIGY